MADEPWLAGPVGGTQVVGDAWLPEIANRLGGVIKAGGGLLDRFELLAGDGFDPSRLNAAVIDFYEHTAEWRLDVWSQWCPAAWPFGWLLSSVFARRLQQLGLPLRALDVAHGLDSRVVAVQAPSGDQLGAAWIRNLRSTGQSMYSGWYGVACQPNEPRPTVRVAFPLPNGNVTVFLRPHVGDNGSLVLTSPLGGFGEAGAYLVVVNEDRESASVRRIPLKEQFVVGVDDEGVLRTDHALELWNIPVLRLHYRLDRVGGSWPGLQCG